jgi:hypothetical protein
MSELVTLVEVLKAERGKSLSDFLKREEKARA